MAEKLLFSILIWRNMQLLPKGADKITTIRKSAAQADFRDGEIGMGQKLFRARKPGQKQITLWTIAGQRFKGMA